MSFVVDTRLEQIVTVPFNLPQTELRRGKTHILWQWVLGRNERMDCRQMALNLMRILTPGVIPAKNNTSLGLASVGLYQGRMLTSGSCLVSTDTVGTVALNSFARKWIATPGTYYVIVANNSSNVDVAVIVTGSLKLYLTG
jgi:hypothetical protein